MTDDTKAAEIDETEAWLAAELDEATKDEAETELAEAEDTDTADCDDIDAWLADAADANEAELADTRANEA